MQFESVVTGVTGNGRTSHMIFDEFNSYISREQNLRVKDLFVYLEGTQAKLT